MKRDKTHDRIYWKLVAQLEEHLSGKLDDYDQLYWHLRGKLYWQLYWLPSRQLKGEA